MRRSGAIIVACVTLFAGCGGDGESAKRDTPAGGDSTVGSLRFVSQNLLHGLACPASSGHCAVEKRVLLFAQQLEASRCPEVVTLQEVNAEIIDLLRRALADRCDSEYAIVWDGDRGADREAVLTTLTVIDSRRVDLAGPLRTAFWVRAASSIGLVDLVTAHLASDSDDRPCDARTCPPPCRADDMLGTCQARQAVGVLEGTRIPESVAVLTGDLNARPDEAAIDAITGIGYADTHVAFGNRECDPTTGVQCTSGRDDSSLAALRGRADAEVHHSERIDYVFFSSASRDCNLIGPTGLFHPEPATDGPSGLAYASDHAGVQAALRCRVNDSDRSVMDRALLIPDTSVVATTTTTRTTATDEATARAITAAFETVFNGDVTDLGAKLAAIEDGTSLRSSLTTRYESLGNLVMRTTVDVEDITSVDANHADVTYSILVDGNVVLDRLAGAAIRVAGRWLVTTRTYCDASTQGQTKIPEPCR